jgi:hypothetical protein
LRTWGKDECRKERISGKEETIHGTLRTREKMSFIKRGFKEKKRTNTHNCGKSGKMSLGKMRI